MTTIDLPTSNQSPPIIYTLPITGIQSGLDDGGAVHPPGQYRSIGDWRLRAGHGPGHHVSVSMLWFCCYFFVVVAYVVFVCAVFILFYYFVRLVKVASVCVV